MVRWLHVIPCGTSVLRNFELSRAGEARALGVVGWFRLPPSDPRQEEAWGVARAGGGSDVYRALLNYLRGGPESASAELNAFLKYVSLSGHAPPGEVGFLTYSTDTGTGYLCAKLIHEYLVGEGYAALTPEPVRVEGLGTSEESLDDGLTNLVDKVVGVIRGAVREGVKVYVNATAGFKPETTFLTLAAALAGATAVYYVHEAFRDVVELPLPPLTLSAGLRKLVKLAGADGMPREEFEEAARSLGLNPQELLEKKLFTLTDKVRPKRWLALLHE